MAGCCCCDGPAALLLSSVVQVEEVCARSQVVPHCKLCRMQDVWDNPAAVADFLNLDNMGEELLGYCNNNNNMAGVEIL